MSNIIKISNGSFKFKDLPFIEYPNYIKNKNGDSYYNFKNSVSKSIYSRGYQLCHRSAQSRLFDSLIELDYFKLLGIQYEIYREVPIINTDHNNINRSYYILDYFIPDLSLCIELDSDFHDPYKDEMKDEFLNSIGIKVYRIDNLLCDKKTKLNELVNNIKLFSHNPFNKSNSIYSDLILENDKMNCNKLREQYGDLYMIRPKWRSILHKLSYKYVGVKEAILTNEHYTINISLNDMHKLIPRIEKKIRSYYPLMRYLKSLNVDLIIDSSKK